MLKNYNLFNLGYIADSTRNSNVTRPKKNSQISNLGSSYLELSFADILTLFHPKSKYKSNLKVISSIKEKIWQKLVCFYLDSVFQTTCVIKILPLR